MDKIIDSSKKTYIDVANELDKKVLNIYLENHLKVNTTLRFAYTTV